MAERKVVAFKGLPVDKAIAIKNVGSILFYRYSPNFAFAGECHLDWEFVYVDKGRVVIEADEKPFTLNAGQFFLHKPMEFHKIRSDGVSSDVFIMAFLLSKGEDVLLRLAGKIQNPDEQEKAILGEIMEENKLVFRETNFFEENIHFTPRFGSIQYVANLLENFFLLSLRNEPEKTVEENEKEPKNSNAILEAATHYLNEHLSENVTFAELSNYLGYSASYLAKLFRSALHSSFKEYSINLKIEKAKTLIVEKNLTFSEIADNLGFSSVQHFSKMFKRKTGFNPTEYQKSVFMRNLYDPFTPV
jgi:AraC-like DNA-binding protein